MKTEMLEAVCNRIVSVMYIKLVDLYSNKPNTTVSSQSVAIDSTLTKTKTGNVYHLEQDYVKSISWTLRDFLANLVSFPDDDFTTTASIF